MHHSTPFSGFKKSKIFWGGGTGHSHLPRHAAVPHPTPSARSPTSNYFTSVAPVRRHAKEHDNGYPSWARCARINAHELLAASVTYTV